MLGDLLRQEREKQNLTIKDIERDTSIRALYISSIEKGQYDALPGEVYLKGFIRTYASRLGLDGAEMMKMYHEEKANPPALQKTPPREKDVPETEEKPAAKAEAEAIPQEPEPKQEIPASAPRQENEEEDAPAEELNDAPPLREKVQSVKKQTNHKALKLLAAAAIVLAAAAGYWFGSGAGETPPPAPVKQQASAPSAPPPKKETPPAPPKETKAVVVQAKFTGKSWIEVVADNKSIYEGIPKIGEAFTWKADQSILIRSGNAGAVEITHNGKPLGKLGDSGEVTAKKFTKDAAANAK